MLMAEPIMGPLSIMLPHRVGGELLFNFRVGPAFEQGVDERLRGAMAWRAQIAISWATFDNDGIER